MPKCDRCGKEQKLPHLLYLLKSNRFYPFDLCDECAHDLFAWVGAKHGHWIYGDYGDLPGTDAPLQYKCSECGGETVDLENYCPKCGAKMEEEAEP